MKDTFSRQEVLDLIEQERKNIANILSVSKINIHSAFDEPVLEAMRWSVNAAFNNLKKRVMT